MVVQLLKNKMIIFATVVVQEFRMKSALQAKKVAISQVAAVIADIIIAIHIRINQSHHKIYLDLFNLIQLMKIKFI